MRRRRRRRGVRRMLTCCDIDVLAGGGCPHPLPPPPAHQRSAGALWLAVTSNHTLQESALSLSDNSLSPILQFAVRFSTEARTVSVRDHCVPSNPVRSSPWAETIQWAVVCGVCCCCGCVVTLCQFPTSRSLAAQYRGVWLAAAAAAAAAAGSSAGRHSVTRHHAPLVLTAHNSSVYSSLNT